jgi:hypothetical protein
VIQDDRELQVTLERIARFERLVEHLRRVETDTLAYRLSAGGFLAEIERMRREVREDRCC